VPASLTGRLIATVVAFVAVVSILVAVTTTVVLRSYLIDKLDQDVDGSLGRVQTAIGGFDPDADRDDGYQGRGGPPPSPRGTREGSISVLVAPDGSAAGTTLTRSGQLVSLDDDAVQVLADVSSKDGHSTVAVPGLGDFRVAAASTPAGATVVQGLPTAGVNETVETLIVWEIVLAALGVGAAAVAGRTLVRRQLKPLRDVAATAHAVTTVDLSSGEVEATTRVPAELTDPSTEVGQVGEALNQLLGHVEAALGARHESEQQARQFLADASHELRTPLSTIKGYSELVRRVQMTDPDDLAQVLDKVEAEAGRMTRLVEDMFLLARLDAGRELQRSPVDLTRVVGDAVLDATVVDPARTWTSDLPAGPVTIRGDEQRLHQLVTNLLRNGTGHTPAGTTVHTALCVADGNVTLTVHDDGPGIDPDLLPTIFDRFTRGDSSRTRASGGAGLGTSLVRAIAHAHGGTVTVTSEPGATTFSVALPI
jgi:two-component system OmpR family sensor kinase